MSAKFHSHIIILYTNLLTHLFLNKGMFKKNKAHGKGKFWYIDGDIYEGKTKERTSF